MASHETPFLLRYNQAASLLQPTTAKQKQLKCTFIFLSTPSITTNKEIWLAFQGGC